MKRHAVPGIFICWFAFHALQPGLLAQGIEITSQANIAITGNATIELNNQGFINNGTYTKGTETVTFSGSGPMNLSGSSQTEMHTLSVTNTGGIISRLNLLTAYNLRIAAGSRITIDPAMALTVSGTITNNAGSTGLVLESDETGTASLLQSDPEVYATVKRFITGSEAWHFLSSPVASQSLGGNWSPTGTYGNGAGYDLYVWNEPTHCWIYKLNTASAVNWNTVHPGTDFTVGRGYLYSIQADHSTNEFSGHLNTGSLSFALTCQSDSLELKGFNLVGNPYPSSVDWRADGWTRTILAETGGGYDMWIWNPVAGNYGVYNSSDADGTGTNSITRYIPPMQAFFVRAANAGDLVMDNTVRVHSGASDWKGGPETASRIGIVVQSDRDKTSDEVRLMFGYDENQAGAGKLFSHLASAPSLFLPDGNIFCTVRYLTNTVCNPAVPLMFTAGSDGSFNIGVNFDPEKFETVLLEDRKTKYVQNLKIENRYEFTGSPSDDPDRFRLLFTYDLHTGGTELPARVFTEGPHVNIDLTLIAQETEVVICDVSGRKLYQGKLDGKALHTVDLKSGTGLIMVYLINPSGTFCRKILMERSY